MGRGLGKWPAKRLGERLALAMKRKGWWNEDRDVPAVLQFCIRAGYVPDYVYKWLNGDKMPSYDNIIKLAHDLDLKPAILVFGEDLGQGDVDQYRARIEGVAHRSVRGVKALLAALALAFTFCGLTDEAQAAAPGAPGSPDGSGAGVDPVRIIGSWRRRRSSFLGALRGPWPRIFPGLAAVPA